jgi:hypothetical protein
LKKAILSKEYSIRNKRDRYLKAENSAPARSAKRYNGKLEYQITSK